MKTKANPSANNSIANSRMVNILVSYLANRMYVDTIEYFVYDEWEYIFSAKENIDKGILKHSILENIDSYELWNKLYHNLCHFQFDCYDYDIDFVVNIEDVIRNLSKSEIDKLTLEFKYDYTSKLIRFILFDDEIMFNDLGNNIIRGYELLFHNDEEDYFLEFLCEKIYEKSPTKLIQLYNFFEVNQNENYRNLIDDSDLLKLIDLRRTSNRIDSDFLQFYIDSKQKDDVLEMYINDEYIDLF